MTNAVKYKLGVMRREDAAHTDHAHKINQHFGMLIICGLVNRRLDVMDLTGRKIERDPRSKPYRFLVRQCFAADRFALREYLFEKPDRLKKFEAVRLIKQFLV